MYAHIKGEIIGAVQFSPEDWCRCVDTGYSYTDPKWRAMGVNQSIIAEIEVHARERGYRYVRRITSVRNISTIRAFEAAAYSPNQIQYTKQLIFDNELGEMNHLGTKKP